MKSPKKPQKTAEEAALEQRQLLALDDEISEQESRLKALSRGKLGSASLLTGAGRTSRESATRSVSGGSSGGSLLRPPGGMDRR